MSRNLDVPPSAFRRGLMASGLAVFLVQPVACGEGERRRPEPQVTCDRQAIGRVVLATTRWREIVNGAPPTDTELRRLTSDGRAEPQTVVARRRQSTEHAGPGASPTIEEMVSVSRRIGSALPTVDYAGLLANGDPALPEGTMAVESANYVCTVPSDKSGN